MILRRPFRQQPQNVGVIDRGNILGAKVITHLPLRLGSIGTRNESVTLGTGGTYVAHYKGRALKGDGVAGAGSFPLDLSAYSSFTVAFWLYWDANASDDHFVGEHGPNWNTSKGFSLQPDESGSGLFVCGSSQGDNTGYWADGFTRPAPATWHRICLSMDRATPVNFAWVDGVAQSLTAVLHTGGLTGNFTSDKFNLFSRNNASLFGAGKLQDLTFYRGALTNAEAAADFDNPWQIFAQPRAWTGDVPVANVGRATQQANRNGFRTWTKRDFRSPVYRSPAVGLSTTIVSTGTAAITSLPNVSAATGAVSVDGSAADTQAKNTSAATGAVAITGTAADTQAANATAGTGAVLVSGTGADTQGANTTSGTGAVAISGTAADTQAKNTTAASGAVSVDGSAADTQGANSTSGTGANLISGSAADTQQPNVSNGAGSVADGGSSTGTADITQAPNTSAASGAVSIDGSADIGQAANVSDGEAATDGAQGAPNYGKKRRYVTKIGNELVVIPDPSYLALLEEPEPEPVKVPIKEIKAKARVYKQEKQVAALIKAEYYEQALKVYEDLQDEEDIEMLLLSL